MKCPTGSLLCYLVVDSLCALAAGGNTGIGKATALHLARKGARVILACRNREKAEATIADIQQVGTKENKYNHMCDHKFEEQYAAIYDE